MKSFLSILTAWAFGLLHCGTCARGAQDDYVLKTPVMSRTVRADGGFLRSVKLEVYGKQVLSAPSVEFMLELDINGSTRTLAPADFEVKEVGTAESGRVQRTEFTLTSRLDELPITLYVRYFVSRDWPYIQKTVTVRPFGRIRGATLRRVVVDDLSLNDFLREPAPECGGPINGLAAFDDASKTGIFWFQGSAAGSERLGRGRTLTLWEDCEHAMGSPYETGRAAIGAARGSVNDLARSFRDYLSNAFVPARKKKRGPDFADVADDKNADTTPSRLAELAELCRSARKKRPDAAVSLTINRPILPADIHLLGIVDVLRIDCSAMNLVDYRRTRWNALQAVPMEALRFIPPPAPREADSAVRTAFDVASIAGGESLEPRQHAFRQKFAKYLEAWQPILNCPNGTEVDGEAHIAHNAGFVFLFNPSDQSRKASLLLGPPILDLKGELRISDWTSLDSGRPIQTIQAGQVVEFEVPARSAMVLGLNAE